MNHFQAYVNAMPKCKPAPAKEIFVHENSTQDPPTLGPLLIETKSNLLFEDWEGPDTPEFLNEEREMQGVKIPQTTSEKRIENRTPPRIDSPDF